MSTEGSFEHIRVEVHEGVGTLTIDRPAVRNALDVRTIRECHAALERLKAEPGLGALIVTGAGDRVFVSGADVNDIRARGRDDGLAAVTSGLFSAVERFPVPTIAAINGYALGGGCELALACDIRVAADTARFGQPETGLGIIPGAGATQRLPALVGMGWAKHLVLTGELIDARQALAIGLVTAVVSPERLHETARAIAGRLLRQGPIATRLAKLALNAAARVDLDSGLLIESLAQTICYQSPDRAEGTAAFLEKRRPNFTR